MTATTGKSELNFLTYLRITKLFAFSSKETSQQFALAVAYIALAKFEAMKIVSPGGEMAEDHFR